MYTLLRRPPPALSSRLRRPLPALKQIKPFKPYFFLAARSYTMSGPTLKLTSGHEMPQVGFGLWKVANDICADTVYNALKAGYRLLDGACGT